jgi:hypothetical protein
MSGRTFIGASRRSQPWVIVDALVRALRRTDTVARGRKLVTLQDAGNYITKLPKAEHEAPEWQAAMEALILVATLGGPTMFARIGVMRALNHHHQAASAPRQKQARKYKVVR